MNFFSATVMRLFEVMLLAACLSCGRQRDDVAQKDFVGTGDAPTVAASPKPRNTQRDVFTVDLITDIVFRYQRDGWTLTEKSDVTAAKLRAGGVDLFFSAVGTSFDGKPNLDEGIAITKRLVDEAGSDVSLVNSFTKVMQNRKNGIVSVMILVEGAGELVNASEERLLDLKDKGVTAIGLVAGKSNGLADAAVSGLGNGGGLSNRGREFVQKLRELGIAVDLTHISKRAFYDVLAGEGVPSMVSHSAADALRPHPRNLDDLQIITLQRTGGLLGLIFNPDFILIHPGTTASVSDVIGHMIHIKKLGALDCLALGTDFAGIFPPAELDDISKLPVLAEKMAEADFTPTEINQVFGKNAARFFESVESQRVVQSPALRPIMLECETAIGEVSGGLLKACDFRVLDEGPLFAAGSRQRFRLQDMTRKPLLLEVFGMPNTPWQVEAQELSGKILIKRVLRLDENGNGQIPLPENRNIARIFLNPTRPSMLREVVVWGE